MTSKSYLSSLQLVELGRRLCEGRMAALELVELIEDARLVVRSLLDAMAAVAAPLGVSSAEIDKMILGIPWYRASRWAPTSPRRMPHSYTLVPLPPPGTVLTGKKGRAGHQRRYAFVFREDAALLLGYEDSKFAHGSLTGLAKAAGYKGQAKRFWKPVGQYESGARLLA